MMALMPMPLNMVGPKKAIILLKYHIDTMSTWVHIDPIETGDTDMTTTEQKNAKILAAIASRGWFTTEIYFNEARALAAAGLIKMGDRYFTGGNRKPVWVAP